MDNVANDGSPKDQANLLWNCLESYPHDPDFQDTEFKKVRHHSEQLSQIIAAEGYAASLDILTRYFSQKVSKWGSRFSNEAKSTGRLSWMHNVTDDGNTFSIGFSPNKTHHYLTLDNDDPYTDDICVWVDGYAVIPLAECGDGEPLLVYRCGPWLSDHLLLICTQTLPNHPYDTYSLYGSAFRSKDENYKIEDIRIYSALIWNCLTKTAHIEHPDRSERWTDPRVRILDGRWYFYANKDAFLEHRHDHMIDAKW